MKKNPTADVCLILEGTYPYVPGGVSTWTHELIQAHSHLTFTIVALLAPDAKPELKFELPSNVVGVQNIYLQKLPRGTSRLPPEAATRLFAALEHPLAQLPRQPTLTDLSAIIDAIESAPEKIGGNILLNSDETWKMMVNMYKTSMPDHSFLDYFWSWRGLLGGLFSVLLFPLPKASVYHALCTGYAGLVLARAHIETGKPCILTEHGIYTNERRIEISSADWLDDEGAFSLSVSAEDGDALKDFWISSFRGYSKLCYDASSRIITLYEGNQAFQRADGAHEDKLDLIPNGIDYDHLSTIQRDENHPPTIALIGRVVPIKDIKTYIRAVNILRSSVPGLQALVLGATDEDEAYYEECRQMVARLDLEDTVIFTGKVRTEDYFPRIDVVVLTSISEAQPLSLLEAGAAGIPSVATNVGACSEIIMGGRIERPVLGAGGAVSALSNPKSTAECILNLLTDKKHYARCSKAIRERVRRHYNKKDQFAAYEELYSTYTHANPVREAA